MLSAQADINIKPIIRRKIKMTPHTDDASDDKEHISSSIEPDYS
jgi:hypothetical protein